jgi:hypothetical protein
MTTLADGQMHLHTPIKPSTVLLAFMDQLHIS